MSNAILEGQIMERVKAVVRPHLKLLGQGQELSEETRLGEAGLDSMASIDLILALEDEFGMAIPDDLLTENSFASLGNVTLLVQEVLAGR